MARSTFPSQNVQNTPASDHFWKLRCRKSARRCGAKHISKSKCTKHYMLGPLLEVDVEKVHAVVARSTFPSQNVQKTPFSDHFWKFRCRKSARCCGAKHISKSKCTKHYMFAPLLEVRMLKSARRFGAKHISKSKCTKHHMFAPLLEVRMLKKCTPLWREAHLEVKMHKSARRCGVKMHKTLGVSDHFWRFRCRFASRHYTTGHYTTLHSSTLHYTTLHSSTLHYTKLHYTTLHYTE